MYKICREMYDDGVGLPFQSQPDLIGDKYVMKYLDLLDLGRSYFKAKFTRLRGGGDWQYSFLEISL